MSQTCKHCGTPLAGYETFCPGCGRELSVDAGAGFRPDTAEDTFTPVTAEKPPKKAAQSTMADEWFPDDFAEPETKPVRKQPVPQRKSAARQTTPQRNAPQRRPAARAPQRHSAPEKNTLTGTQRKVFLGAMAVLAVILVIVGINMLRGGGEKQRITYPFTSVVDQYFDSVRTANAGKFVATRPAAYTAYLTSGTGSAYENESDYRSQMAATLQTRLEEYRAQYGDIKSIEYELSDVKQYNHRCEALSNVLTGWYNFPENAVTDAYIVSGAYTVQGSKGSGTYDIAGLLLIQIDGEWYFSPDAGSYWKGE